MQYPITIGLVSGWAVGTVVTLLLIRYTASWLNVAASAKRGGFWMLSGVEAITYDCAGHVTGRINGASPYPCAIWAVVDATGHSGQDPHIVTNATRVSWTGNTTGPFTISNAAWPRNGMVVITLWTEFSTQFGSYAIPQIDCGMPT